MKTWEISQPPLNTRLIFSLCPLAVQHDRAAVVTYLHLLLSGLAALHHISAYGQDYWCQGRHINGTCVLNQNKKSSNKWTLKGQYLIIFLKNRMLCNEKEMISNILLLCIRISLFDTASVYDSKSCCTQYIPLCVFFGPLFCGWMHSAPKEKEETMSCRGSPCW